MNPTKGLNFNERLNCLQTALVYKDKVDRNIRWTLKIFLDQKHSKSILKSQDVSPKKFGCLCGFYVELLSVFRSFFAVFRKSVTQHHLSK